VVKKSNLSSDTHERVTAVVFSIIMVICVLFYFKGGFNFDEKSSKSKKLAKIWTFKWILILSAIIKKLRIYFYFGLTYKRLGVFVS
jgi:hypothetical protein